MARAKFHFLRSLIFRPRLRADELPGVVLESPPDGFEDGSAKRPDATVLSFPKTMAKGVKDNRYTYPTDDDEAA